MSSFRRSTRLALLLAMVLVIVAGPLSERVSAQPSAVVHMSPGTYAHTLDFTDSNDTVKLDYPKGAIIQNTTGDISLSVRLNSTASSIAIYIPPEFTFVEPETTSVWTSITNDYNNVTLTRLSSLDPIGPSWWRVRISNSTIPVGNYSVRMFDIRAPEVCGRYFVKVFINGTSIGSGNFPTIVVKGDLYPAYISGRVLNADRAQYGAPVNASGKVVAEGKTALGKTVKAQAYFKASANTNYTLYGLAAGTYNLTASAAGFVPVTLNGTVSVDAGQSLEGIDIYVYPSVTISGTICSKCGAGMVPWGRLRPISIEVLNSNLESIGYSIANGTKYDPSQPYYNFTFRSIELDGHVPQDNATYVSGLASGDYYLRAYVNGYLQRDVVPVHVYDYMREVAVPFDLWRSSQFNVTVHFMDAEGSPGPTRWGGRLTLKAYPLEGTMIGSNSTYVGPGHPNSTMAINGERDHGLPRGTYAIEAEFPGYSQAGPFLATLGDGCNATTFLSFDMIKGGILNLTLRSVNWQTTPHRIPWGYPYATIRIEAMDSLGDIYVGTGKQLAGNDTTFANVTGLPTDAYLIRVYTVGYIQTRDYHVSVSSVSISDIAVDLVKAPRIQVTLTFRKEGLEAPIDTYPYPYNLTEAPVRIEVYDSYGLLAGANATHIPANKTSSTVEVVGFHAYAGDPSVRWVNYYDATDGQLQKDYGLTPGKYLVFVWVPGYMQAGVAAVSLSPVMNVTLTMWLDKLAHVYGNVGGLDMYDNLIPLSWATVTAYGSTLTATSSLDGYYEMWIMNGTYTLGVSSLGYAGQQVEIVVWMAWETPVDFDLTPASGAAPELSAAELTLPVVLIMVCVSLYRKKNPGDSPLERLLTAKSKPARTTRAKEACLAAMRTRSREVPLQ